MNFQEKLTEYMETLHCSAKDLSKACGLSAATLSRYRSGERSPEVDTDQFEKLVFGISRIAKKQGLSEFSYENVRATLQDALTKPESPELFAENLDLLIQTLHINVSQMARAMNYDASFLSKIRKKQRYPSDIRAFCHQASTFVAANYTDENSLKILAEIMDCEPLDISERNPLTQKLGVWLSAGQPTAEKTQSQTSDFLHKLDEFDLEDYIRAIHFDDLKVPTVPFQFPSSKTYHGMNGQKKAEIDFLRGVVLSKSKEPIFLYSDMDMATMSQDKSFSKKWLLGMAMILKKEQPITIIHNLNRPFHELMLGLEAYIPLYMTGLVSPYYFKGVHNAIFRHFLYVSGTYSLSGQTISDHPEMSRFSLTNNKEEVTYFRRISQILLKKAQPLMDIYTAENREALAQFRDTAQTAPGNRHVISSVLPLFTLPPERLETILSAAGLSKEEQKRRQTDAEKQRRIMEQFLRENSVLEELPFVSREEYLQHPLVLSFTDTFSAPVPYSYEDYASHLEYTKAYAAAHPHYQIKLNADFAFRNIRIEILKGKWVWISKIASSPIHFIIYQRQLREAIENMYIAMFESYQ